MTKRRWRQLGAALAAGSVLYPLVGTVAAYAMTRRASARFEEPPPAGFEPVRLETDDGVRLGAWWRSPASPRCAAVLAHGNGASRTHLGGFADALLREGCAVLPVSLRAHGDSDGDHNDIGWSARHDIVAAVRETKRRAPGQPLVVLGVSLGAAAALYAADMLGEEVDGMILVGPFAELELAVRRRTQRYLPPFVEALAYGALRLGALFCLPDLDRMRPSDAARSVHPDVRVLIFAGAEDDRAPLSDAHTIAAAVPGRATVVAVPGVDHEDLADVASSDVWHTARRWLDELTPR